MKALRTTTCEHHGHPELRIAYDSDVVLANDAEWLLRWIEESVAGGMRFEIGQTCQVGWIVTQIRLHESGDLILWEPDMQGLPVQWSEAVNYTLAHLRTQKDVVESVLGAEDLLFPSMCQSALICTRIANSGGVVMERVEPNNTDSGWFCGCREAGHDHNDVAELRRVSLYEAAVRHATQIVPYLALPPGILACVSGGPPEVFRDGELLTFKPGSYLAERHAGR